MLFKTVILVFILYSWIELLPYFNSTSIGYYKPTVQWAVFVCNMLEGKTFTIVHKFIMYSSILLLLLKRHSNVLPKLLWNLLKLFILGKLLLVHYFCFSFFGYFSFRSSLYFLSVHYKFVIQNYIYRKQLSFIWKSLSLCI